MPVSRGAAAPELDPVIVDERATRPAHRFEVHSNPSEARAEKLVQQDLFNHTPSGTVVTMPTGAQARRARMASARAAAGPQSGELFSELAPVEPFLMPGKSLPRRRPLEHQQELNFDAPVTHRPFANVLNPAKDLIAAPLRLRAYSLLADACVVLLLVTIFSASVFVSFRASQRVLGMAELSATPLLLLALIPVLLSAAYTALWAVFEMPTVGQAAFRLGIVSLDGHRPTVGQRLMRVFAGWLAAGSLVGPLWTLVNQERFSIADLVSQTCVILRAD
jgi:uncharacterized RDD family membrane protein YckC